MKWRANSKLARAGRVLGDRYRLEAPLGRGAMGEIWRAEHLRLRCPVAIKFLDSAIADDPEMLNRFLREAQSAAAVRSPHVVQIFDSGVERGAPYISMELLQGQTLEARLKERQFLTPAELSPIFREISLAVSKAHEVGVVHRDLKPGNIFLAREGEGEITKVLDFGIAKVVSHISTQTGGLTVTGTLLGTPHYMSPEQARGSREVDFRSDLWSLAIIAFECLTGQQAFSGRALGELVVQICTEEPRIPSSLAAVPAGFDEWFRTGTSKDPRERFASARQMADSLGEILASSTAQEEPRRAHAGTPGASDSLRSVTVPLGRLAQRRTVVEGRSRSPGEAGKPLAALRPVQRWLPASILLGATLLLGASRWLWSGTSRPAPVLTGTAAAAPPARAEQWQAPLVPAPSAPALPATPTPEREAASPAGETASATGETAEPERETQAAVAIEHAPVAPQPAVARAVATSPSPARRSSKPVVPVRPAAPRVRSLAEASAAHPVPLVAEPASPPSSKRTTVDPFAERL